MKFAIGLLLLMNAEVCFSASEPDYNACAQIYVGVSDAGGKLEAREA
jgi:capsular polysaccharide biosynthesis protein